MAKVNEGTLGGLFDTDSESGGSASDITYDLKVEEAATGANLVLEGSDGSTDTVTITGEGGTTVEQTDDGIVITTSSTDTTYEAGTGLELDGTVFSLEGNVFTDADQTKLAGLDATADNTAAHLVAGGGIEFDNVDGVITISAPFVETDYTGINGVTVDNEANTIGLTGLSFTSAESSAISANTTKLAGIEAGADKTEGKILAGGDNVDVTNNGDGTVTIDASDTDTTYTAGDGLTLTGTEFSVDYPYTEADHDKLAGIEEEADKTVDRIHAGTGVTLSVSGPDVTINADVVDVTAGAGINVSGTDVISLDADLNNLNDVSITSPVDEQFLAYNGSQWVNAKVDLHDLSDVDLHDTPPALNDLLIYNGGTWINQSREDVYDNLALIGNVDIDTSETIPTGYVLTWDGNDEVWKAEPTAAHEGVADLTDVNISDPENDQVLRYEDGEWVNKDLEAGETYSAGTGIDLSSGNVFSLDADLSDLNDVSSTGATNGQYLQWDGDAWSPATIAQHSLTTFKGEWSSSSTYESGDVVHYTDNNLYIWEDESDAGSANVPGTDSNWIELSAGTTYAAGTGLSLSGTTFSVDNPFTSADETKLDGIDAGADVTKDNITGGTDISTSESDGVVTINHDTFTTTTLSPDTQSPAKGGSFTVTSGIDTDNGHVTDIHRLTVTLPDDGLPDAADGLRPASGNTHYILNAPAGTGDFTWVEADYAETSVYTGQTDAGKYTVPQRDTGNTSTKFLREDGDWIIPTDTTYSAGNGIDLTGTTFSADLDGSTLTLTSDGLSVTNPFTDADETKLDGIETGADVTPSWVPDTNPNYLTSETNPNVPDAPSRDSSEDKRYELRVPTDTSESISWLEVSADSSLLAGNGIDIDDATDTVSVDHDSTLTIDTDNGNKLVVANPFTEADEAVVDLFTIESDGDVRFESSGHIRIEVDTIADSIVLGRPSHDWITAGESHIYFHPESGAAVSVWDSEQGHIPKAAIEDLSITDLSNVTYSGTPTDGQLLTWDNTNSTWTAQTPASHSFTTFKGEWSSTATYSNGDIVHFTDNNLYLWTGSTDSSAGTSPADHATNDWVEISAASVANDATITLTAGTGLSGGGDFTTDQATNETLTLNVTAFDGADGTDGGSIGGVPAPVATDNVKFLRGDGTWQTVSQGGEALTAGNGISISSDDVVAVDLLADSGNTKNAAEFKGDSSDELTVEYTETTSDGKTYINTIFGNTIRGFDTTHGIEIATFIFNSFSYSFDPAQTLDWDEPMKDITVSTSNNSDFQGEYITSMVTSVSGAQVSTRNFTEYSATVSDLVTTGELGNHVKDPDTSPYDGTTSANVSVTTTATTNNGKTGNGSSHFRWGPAGFTNTSTDIGQLSFDRRLTTYQITSNIHPTNDTSNISSVSVVLLTPDEAGGSANPKSFGTGESSIGFGVSGASIYHDTRINGNLEATFTRPSTVTDNTGTDAQVEGAGPYDVTPTTLYKTWVVLGNDTGDFSIADDLGTLSDSGYSVSSHGSSTSLGGWQALGTGYSFDNSSGSTAVAGYLVVPSVLNSARAFKSTGFGNPTLSPTVSSVTLGHTGHTVAYTVYKFTVPLAGTVSFTIENA